MFINLFVWILLAELVRVYAALKTLYPWFATTAVVFKIASLEQLDVSSDSLTK